MSFRLSPNEEAAVLRQERDRRRKLRIQQVREQERQFARKVRHDVRQRKSVELKVLSEQLEDNWVKEKNEKTQVLRQIFEKNLEHIGEGHRAAANQEPQDGKRAAVAVLNKKAAQRRHNVALDKFRDEQDERNQKKYAHILSRLTALEIEKARAAKIASLPLPAKEHTDEVKPTQPVKCVQDFSTTHYHVPIEYVEKAEPHEQGDAKAAAIEEGQRLEEEHRETVRESKERKEKAILRHKHAHKRALLEQDMGRLMEELGQMEQADRRRRQAVVAKIPHQVFQPPHRRLEEREENQLNLEQAFEDMYMANTEFTGDLTLALEPRVPQCDADLDLTTESSPDDAGVTLQPPAAAFPHGSDAPGHQGKVAKPLSRSETLQKLMRKIQGQREDSREKSVQDLSTAHVAGVPSQSHVADVPSQSHVAGIPTQSQRNSEQPTHTQAEPSQPTLDEGSTATLTSSEGSTVAKTSELSEHPILSDIDNGKASQELTDETMSEPIITGSPSIMHPMERAAKLRSSSQLPDMNLLKKQQQQLMKKDEEQRQQLARRQLDSHTGQHKHLQALQRNLEERQQALNRQIEQQDNGQMYNRHSNQGQDVAVAKHSQQGDVQPPMQTPSGDEAKISPPRIMRSNQESVHLEPDKELSEEHSTQQQVSGQRIPEEDTLQPQNLVSLPQQSSQNVLVTDMTRTSENVTVPAQSDPIRSDIDLRTQRIRNYQLQLLTQQRQSRNNLVEAQTRLQQRRMNLINEYPEIKLPDYSPYVSQLLGQEPSVIYSPAEKELGPVPITSDEYGTAGGRQLGFQSTVPAVNHLISGQVENGTLQTTRPQEQQVSFHYDNALGTERRQDGVSSNPLAQGTSQMASQYRLPSGEQPGQSRVYGKLPQEPSLTTSNERIPQDMFMTQQTSTQDQGDQIRGYREPEQVEQPIIGRRPPQEPKASNEQNAFKDFLREQREKLELKNKEQQERLKLKQEQLKEQIKRQMEQYRDNSIHQRQETADADDATETNTSLIQQSCYETDTSGDKSSSQFHYLSSRIHEPSLLPIDQADDQMKQVPSDVSYQSRFHHRPPPPSHIFTDQREDILPHELSTIIEVDTPRSERKSIVNRPLQASQKSSLQNNLSVERIYQQVDRREIRQDIVPDRDLLRNAQRDMLRVFEDDSQLSSHSMTPHTADNSVLPVSPDAGISALGPMYHSSTFQQDHSFLHKDFGGSTIPAPLFTKDKGDIDETNNQVGNYLSKGEAYVDTSPEIPQNYNTWTLMRQEQRSRIEDHRIADVRDDASSIPTCNRTPFETIPAPSPATNYHLTAASAVETSTLATGDSFKSRDSRSAARYGEDLREDGRFTMYSHDVGRGVISYPTSKTFLPSSIPGLSVPSHTAPSSLPPTTQQTYVRSDTTNISGLPAPSHTAPFSLPSTTQQTRGKKDTGNVFGLPFSSHTTPSTLPSTTQQTYVSCETTTQPVIEIFQPTVDNLPYTTTLTLPEDDQHFGVLPRRSFGSDSSSSIDTPKNNNGSTQFMMPKNTKMTSYQMGPLSVRGEAQADLSSSSSNSFTENTNSNASPQQRTPNTNEMQRASSNSEDIITSDSLTQRMNPENLRMQLMESDSREKQKSISVKWKDVLAERQREGTPLTDQSRMSVLSEHLASLLSMTASEQVSPETSHHATGDMDRRKQYGSIQIASITDGFDRELQEVEELDDVNLTQHPISDSPAVQKHDQEKTKLFDKKLNIHTGQDASPLPKYTLSPSQYESIELSEHTIDPTFSSFLQLPTTETIPGNQDVCDQASSDLPSQLRTDAAIPEPELSQHRVDNDVHIDLNQSHPRNYPSKDSLSSIEQPRYQTDQDNINYQLLPMFSDVSISQRSMSFSSEKDQELLNQGQRASEMTTMSDRYSFPWPYDDRTNMQSGSNTEQGMEMFQRWHVGLSEFVGQTSMESTSENQFHPLHEITSSTQQGDQHTASVDTGILEEPDLTLVSLNTTECSVLPDSQQDEIEPPSDGNFASSYSELIDVEMSNMSSEVKENIHPSAAASVSDGSQVPSLQEAFSKRKARFIQASKTRVEEAKVRAKDQAATAISTSVQPKHKLKPSSSQTSANHSKQASKKTPRSSHQPKKDKTKVLQENKREGSQDGSTSSQTSAKMQRSKSRTTTMADRKAAEKEMYKRTGRLYNQLDEVKKKKVETDRKEHYAANRQKRKEFEQKLQTRLNKWAKHKD
ncbi:uncharacterized protein [Amphiura filiformis]|uniref:uncharacterized protein n=1 Tax=Amphiura filiformis TaxID=82378 RepID=UPI003B212C76